MAESTDIAAGQPPLLHEAYVSSRTRAPGQKLIRIPQTLSEATGPAFGTEQLWAGAEDLTRQVPGGEAAGQRIYVHGRVTDETGHPVRTSLIEVWQANAAGRYAHDRDRHDAPVDPYCVGRGAVDASQITRKPTLKTRW